MNTSITRTYNIIYDACKDVNFPYNSGANFNVVDDIIWEDNTPLMEIKTKSIYKILTNDISVWNHVNNCWGLNSPNTDGKKSFRLSGTM